MRLLVFVIALVSFCAQAQQFPFEFWHEGKLVLESGDTLKGQVKYDLQSDIIQLQVNKRNQSYTARKVLFFEIFDQSVKRYRLFFSLPYAISGEYKSPVFFEFLEEGKITLLCRERVEYRTFYSPYYFGSYTRMVLVYNYYLLEENGEIKEVDDKKNDWLALMGNKADEVEKFAKTNKLSFDDREELVKIVAYYNSLAKPK